MGKHGLYKYECEGKVIYIGKSDANVVKRISDHKREAKFKPYLKKGVSIYTCELPNSTETKLVEQALINQYKPILNGTDNQKGFSKLIKIDEPEWIFFDEDAFKAEKLDSLQKSSKSKALPSFPRELLNVPFIGVERVKEGREWHEELVIAPNGRIKMQGFKDASEEELTYPKYLYPTITFRFYDETDNKYNAHEENGIHWILRDIKNIEHTPSDILESLMKIFEMALLQDKNFGEDFLLKLSAEENTGPLVDLLNSGVDVDFPDIGSVFSFSDESRHYKNGKHDEYHINKSNLFHIYTALLASTPEKLQFNWLLEIYFRITPPANISKGYIQHLLRMSGHEDDRYQHEVINKIRIQIGGEYHEEWAKREEDEYKARIHAEYVKYLDEAITYIDQARFVILTNNHAYVIGKGEDDFIIANIKKYGDEQPIMINWAEKDIVDLNGSDFEYYPEIYLLPDDFKRWHHGSLDAGIPKIHAEKGIIWQNPTGIIELPWHIKKDSEPRDIVLEAYKAMMDRGF